MLIRAIRKAASLEGAAFHRFPHRDVNQVSGHKKRRWLYNPNGQMRLVHANLLMELKQLGVDLSSATGALKGQSALTNIQPHRRNRFFFLLDIRHAYESVNGDELCRVLSDLDKYLPQDNLFYGSDRLKTFLNRFCLTSSGGLLTGAPASPLLYNIYLAVVLDKRLKEICARSGLVYTRYIDDLTFSSPIPIGRRKRQALLGAVRDAGLVIHEGKTQLRDLKRGAVMITGLRLNWGGQITLPRAYTSKIRGFLHQAIQERKTDLDTRRLVSGLVSPLLFSLKDLRFRRRGRKTPLRAPNATEAKVLDLYRDYGELCQTEKAAP